MGYIGSRENGLNTIGKRDLTMNFIENRENTCESGSRGKPIIPPRITTHSFTGIAKILSGLGFGPAKFLLGFGIRVTPFTPSWQWTQDKSQHIHYCINEQ